MLKDWIDNNLPRLVEKIVAEELKKLIQKNSNVN
jgi:cell pole-organizing protein PopZ